LVETERPYKKIKFIRHEENRGIFRSLNEILTHAKGEYFSEICDDLWEGNRQDDLRNLDDNDDSGMIFSNANIIDKDPNLTNALYGDRAFINRIYTEFL
jgi:glycosyltransferase involved in cell wall biosynthesis